MIWDTFWLPPDLGEVSGHYVTQDILASEERVTLRHFFPDGEGILRLMAYLRSGQTQLRSLGIDARIQVLDRLAQRWLRREDPLHTRVVSLISGATGLSLSMIHHALDLEHLSSRAEDILSALRRELGSPRVLDRPQVDVNLKGRTMASGPGLVGVIFSGNIPGLPHLEMMRAMLVGSPCLGKVPSSEPIFLAAWLQSLWEINPQMARAFAAVSVERGSGEVASHLARGVDHLTIYGGEVAVNTWLSLTPRRTPVTLHGHHLGVSLVTARAQLQPPADLARLLAYDFSLFDQQACLSPVVLYLEDAGENTLRLMEELCEEMGRWFSVLEPRRLSPAKRAYRRGWLDERMMEGCRSLLDLPGLAGVVLVGPPSPPTPLPHGRTLWIQVVPNCGDILELLKIRPEYLQNVGLAAHPEEEPDIIQALAELGVSRVCPPGLMGRPSMMWHHDGRRTLADLVSWCDVEEQAPGITLMRHPTPALPGNGQ